MPKNHIVKFRVTKEQHEDLKYLANQDGFLSISHFVRHSLFSKSDLVESKILETNKLVKMLLGENWTKKNCLNGLES